MSRRTSEASKAIRAAWQKEQKLVAEGKGTRDWTPEQQKEILELGKAYYHSENPEDANDGKAFEGHHMKSAEAYPEYQGDPDNIQFLSRSEHQEAHGGDYRNPTNGYFDPVTKTVREFGDNRYESCEIIELTNPIVKQSNAKQISSETEKDSRRETYSGNKLKKDTGIRKKPSTSKTSTTKIAPKTSFGKKMGKAIKGVVKYIKGGAKEVVKKNPEELKALGKICVSVCAEIIENRYIKSAGNSNSSSLNNKFGGSSDGKISDSLITDDSNGSSADHNYPDDRLSPKEHEVSKHWQRYHTKDGVEWKKKQPYQRGGKHDED